MTLTSVENTLKSGVHDLKVAGEAVLKATSKVVGEATVVEPVVNQVLANISPAAATVAETAEGILAKVAKAIQDAGDAASAHGINVTFDTTVVADVKAIIAAL